MSKKRYSVTIEETVVYQFIAEAADPDTAELDTVDAFMSGELPNNGPSEGERHKIDAFVRRID